MKPTRFQGPRAAALRAAAIAVVATAVPLAADAFYVAIDFDDDGDPSTVRSTIQAPVGDLVVGLVTLDFIPYPYEYVGGIQFGLDATSGLELVGAYGTDGSSGFLTDGPGGIAIAFGVPLANDDLPWFTTRLVFRVTSSEPQTIAIAPSTGWGETYSGLVMSVRTEDGDWQTVVSDIAIRAQLRGLVNGGDTLPVQTKSWSAIRKFFSDDTL